MAFTIRIYIQMNYQLCPTVVVATSLKKVKSNAFNKKKQIDQYNALQDCMSAVATHCLH